MTNKKLIRVINPRTIAEIQSCMDKLRERYPLRLIVLIESAHFSGNLITGTISIRNNGTKSNRV